MPSSVLVIAGPTASQKSALALRVAERCAGAIVNGDSQQVYRGLPILTAQPSSEEQEKCPHCLFGNQEPSLSLSAWEWVQRAVPILEKLLSQGRQPIVVGGTGFYLKTLMEGLCPIPPLSPEQKARTAEQLAQEGSEALWHRVSQVDGESAARINCKDLNRLSRVWSVFEQTQIPFSQWQKQPRKKLGEGLRYVVVGVIPGHRQLLYEAINARFVSMVQRGALEEVRAFQTHEGYRGFPAYQALGAGALDGYLRGLYTKEEAISKGQQQSRNYAKRQLTWFRHQQTFHHTLDPFGPSHSLASMTDQLLQAVSLEQGPSVASSLYSVFSC